MSGDLEMDRLVLLMIRVGKEHGRKLVEGYLAVGLRIGDRLVLLRGIQRLRSGLRATEVPNSESPAYCTTCRGRRARRR